MRRDSWNKLQLKTVTAWDRINKFGLCYATPSSWIFLKNYKTGSVFVLYLHTLLNCNQAWKENRWQSHSRTFVLLARSASWREMQFQLSEVIVDPCSSMASSLSQNTLKCFILNKFNFDIFGIVFKSVWIQNYKEKDDFSHPEKKKWKKKLFFFWKKILKKKYFEVDKVIILMKLLFWFDQESKMSVVLEVIIQTCLVLSF